MTSPLPIADPAYEREIDAAYHVRGKVILRLLNAYVREPDLRRAMDGFNAAVFAEDVEGIFRESVASAQRRLRERDAARRAAREPSFIGGLPEDQVGICQGCHGRMIEYEPGQTHHPMCEPQAAPADAAAPDAPGFELEPSSEWPADDGDEWEPW